MRRVRRLSVAALAATLLQVTWGGFTRGSGSGYGCSDRWPLCEGGWLQIGDAGGLLPRPEFHMVVEWLHRWIALLVGVLLVWLVVALWRRHRHRRRLLVPAALALAVIVAQSLVGAAVVVTDLRADLVTVHLIGALVLLGVLSYATVHAFPPAERPAHDDDGAGRRWAGLVAAGAGVVAATMVLGSTVHNQYVAGWPLVGGQLVPDLFGESRLVTLHWLHRVAAGAGVVYLAWLAWRAPRRGRPVAEVWLVQATLGLFVLNVALGLVHVVTTVSSVVAVVAHLGVSAAAWSAAVGAWTLARRDRAPAASAAGWAGGPARVTASR